MGNYLKLRLFLLLEIPFCMCYAAHNTYTLSKDCNSYSGHLVKGGGNVTIESKSYMVDVPDGYTVRICLTKENVDTENCDDKSIYADIKGIRYRDSNLFNQDFVFTSSGNISIYATATAGLSWREPIYWMHPTLGIQISHYVDHYYTTYYYGVRYTITATYDAPKIIFNGNGGSGTMASQVFTKGVSQNLTLNRFSRSGYLFQGWATSPKGNVVYSDGQNISISSTVTLYAKWSVIDGAFDLKFSLPVGRSWKKSFFLNNNNDVTALDSFTIGSVIYRNYCVYNDGSKTLNDDFYILHEILRENIVVCSYKQFETVNYGSESSQIRVNERLESGLANLVAGSYVYRCTIDSDNVIPEMDESNNVIEYPFTITDVISKDLISVNASGGYGEVFVDAKGSWTVSSSSSWITVSTTSGTGYGSFSYTVAPNTIKLSRTGNVIVSVNGISRTITVVQEAFGPKAKISSVIVTPRWPWNGKVDIDYTLETDSSGRKAIISMTGQDGVLVRTLTPMAVTGTGVNGALGSSGRHRITWDIGADYPNFHSELFTVNMSATPVENDSDLIDGSKYLVIDLSGGVNAASYPISYLNEVPTGGWTDEYKTTKMVLRLISPGTFKMSNSYDIEITKPYYIGVFEVTKKQYALVTGVTYIGDKYPVSSESWNNIRGNSSVFNWPSVKTVDQNSFIGRIREKTGLMLDLPTEAQWEFACRAGTTTLFSYGSSVNGDYMWYTDNSSGNSHEVGTKYSNSWGLFDMHGNVDEWCLDWYEDSLSKGIDPEGPSSGLGRVRRGGWYSGYDFFCTSSKRTYDGPGTSRGVTGFRLARTIVNE